MQVIPADLQNGTAALEAIKAVLNLLPLDRPLPLLIVRRLDFTTPYDDEGYIQRPNATTDPTHMFSLDPWILLHCIQSPPTFSPMLILPYMTNFYLFKVAFNELHQGFSICIFVNRITITFPKYKCNNHTYGNRIVYQSWDHMRSGVNVRSVRSDLHF